MNHDTDQLRQRLPELLTPAKNKPFFICPLCGSGTGPHATGAAKLQDDGVHLKCFACDFYGDVFDLLDRAHIAIVPCPQHRPVARAQTALQGRDKGQRANTRPKPQALTGRPPAMERRPCAECGKSFTPKSNRAQYCGEKCKAKAKRDHDREWRRNNRNNGG